MGPTTLPASHYSPLGMRYTSAVALLMLMMIVQLSSYIVWALAALSHPLYHLAFRPELIFQILSLYGLALVGGLLVLLFDQNVHGGQLLPLRIDPCATLGLVADVLYIRHVTLQRADCAEHQDSRDPCHQAAAVLRNSGHGELLVPLAQEPPAFR